MMTILNKVLLGGAAGMFACAGLLHAILLVHPPPGTWWLHCIDLAAAGIAFFACGASLVGRRTSPS